MTRQSRDHLAPQLLREFVLEGDRIVRVSTGRVVPFSPDARGYGRVGVQVDGRTLPVLYHRLLFLLRHGHLRPVVDHAVGALVDPLDVRGATLGDNCRNQGGPPRAVSGARGVARHGNRWQARITYEGTSHLLGSYPTREQAQAVYEAMAEEMFGEFYRPPEKR